MSDGDYDHLGNYIGGDITSDEDSDDGDFYSDDDSMTDNMQIVEAPEISNKHQIVEADSIITPDNPYGDVETIHCDEDTQLLSQPIIPDSSSKQKHTYFDDKVKTTYASEFLAGLMDYPQFHRMVAVVGAFHHGKTSFIDMLVQHTHIKPNWSDNNHTLRYTDSRIMEQQRGLSIKTKPISVVTSGLAGKSHLITILDTPGHVDFSDEVVAALRVVDGVYLVVDVVEGVLESTKQCIREICRMGLKPILVLNKMDRLIVECQLVPSDALAKLEFIIEQVNAYFVMYAVGTTTVQVNPIENTVIFASPKHKWAFTLDSFAHSYTQAYPSIPDHTRFRKFIWGKQYLQANRSIKPTRPSDSAPTTFMQFLLEPLFKIYSHTLSHDSQPLIDFVADIGVELTASEALLDAADLLIIVLSRFFNTSIEAITDPVLSHTPSPLSSASRILQRHYNGPQHDTQALAMIDCDKNGPLCIQIFGNHVVSEDSIMAVGRVMSGTLHVGDSVRVCGPHYSSSNTEDSSTQRVSRISIFQGGRYHIDVNRAVAGSIIAIEGVSSTIVNTGTIFADDNSSIPGVFTSLVSSTVNNMKIAVEPYVPTNLPKLITAIRSCCQTYTSFTTRTEESGEHVLLGTGELQLDCILHDIREIYGKLEVKTSDPSVEFRETVDQKSALICFASTPNRLNTFSVTSESLDKPVCDDIRAGRLVYDSSTLDGGETFTDIMENMYQWDALSSRNVWTFGPHLDAPNLLINDTLSLGEDRDRLQDCREAIIDGYNWALREGPLCGGLIQNVRVNLVEASIAPQPLQRAKRMVIPTMRRAVYSSLLTASPRIMEPIQYCEFICHKSCQSIITQQLASRRGHVINTKNLPGTPLFMVEAKMPLIESFGFETDIRSASGGFTQMSSKFHEWNCVPGDPLDKVFMAPLQIASIQNLAYDFTTKTRRRKGLSDNLDISKYMDDDMTMALLRYQQSLEDDQY